jgi:hypothetical protein
MYGGLWGSPIGLVKILSTLLAKSSRDRGIIRPALSIERKCNRSELIAICELFRPHD